MNKLRTVIIGMGRMGKTRYQAMKQHGGFEIVAVCDTVEELLAPYIENEMSYSENGTPHSENGIAAYTDWKECIEKEKPKAVIVCTINVVIPDVVCFALEHGCHVFSEKPPGRSLSDVLRMKESYFGRQGQVLKFGFNHRYHYSVIEAKSLLDSKFLGNVVAIRGVYGKAGNLDKNEWRNDISLAGGGILLDQGIHMLDLLRYFAGDFAEISGFIDHLVWKESVGEDTAFATLRTADGKIATLHSSAIQWKHKFDIDIICTNGYIALNGLLTSTLSYGEERITYYKKDLELKSGKLGNPTEYTLCFDEDNSWNFEMEEFYNAVIGKDKVLNGTIDDALAVMKLIGELYGRSIG